MRLIVTKPEEGRVNLTVDDRRGSTGKKWSSKGVLVEDVPGEVGELLEVWEKRRKAIKEARKPVPA